MYRFLTAVLLSLGLSFFGALMDELVEKMIGYKEFKNKKEYERYKIYTSRDMYINILIIFIASLSSFLYFGLARSLYNIIFIILAVFLVRLDEKIRIIPNEAVIFILGFGFINHLYFRGIKGIFYGLMGLVATAILFFLAAFITKLFYGRLGVGAGDIKLAMAISFLLGVGSVFNYWLGISIFLLAYILIGLYTKTIRVGNTFPMALQVIGGLIFVIYEPMIKSFINWCF